MLFFWTTWNLVLSVARLWETCVTTGLDCTVLLGRFDITQMGRMHSGGKGISKSSLPYKRSPPSWLKISAQEVTDHVCKLAKKGLTPSQVGNY